MSIERPTKVASLAKDRRWAVLALGQTVDAVIEKDVVDVEVASQHVHKMIAADRQRVAVSGNYPDTQFGIRGLDSGGDCRRAAMNTVKAVGVHVVRKARRAADAGNKNRLLAR